MSTKKNNPIMDLKQLREDYNQGFSAMGQQDRGYYITNWRGMQSLQAYCTSELVHHWGGGAHDDKLREVQAKDGGKQYGMKSWTYDRFEHHLVEGLNEIDVPIKKSAFSYNSDAIYEAVIDNVYNGELDRTAFIEAATSRSSPMMRYDVEMAMKLDILRAKDGDTDRFAKAGAFAYEKGLASSARLVDFDESGNSKDELMGNRYLEKNNDEWLRQAEKLYLENLLEKPDGVDTVSMDLAKETIGTIQTATPKDMRRREGDWNKLVDYMQKEVVFFLDEQHEISPGLGMKYQRDIHNAVGLSEKNDWKNSYGKYEPRHIHPDNILPSQELSQDDGMDF